MVVGFSVPGGFVLGCVYIIHTLTYIYIDNIYIRMYIHIYIYIYTCIHIQERKREIEIREKRDLESPARWPPIMFQAHRWAFICKSQRCSMRLHVLLACMAPFVTRVTFPIRSSSLKHDPCLTLSFAPADA